jgi:hypothetical protein
MDIVIDFDGTCVEHCFPEIGGDIGAVPVLKRLVEAGHRLILFTMRCDNQAEATLENGYVMHGGDFLKMAVDWFRGNGIELFGIQRNPEQDIWTTSPKAYGQLIIDDAALGCPLIYPGDRRPYVNWAAIEAHLVFTGILPGKKKSAK